MAPNRNPRKKYDMFVNDTKYTQCLNTALHLQHSDNKLNVQTINDMVFFTTSTFDCFNLQAQTVKYGGGGVSQHKMSNNQLIDYINIKEKKLTLKKTNNTQQLIHKY